MRDGDEIHRNIDKQDINQPLLRPKLKSSIAHRFSHPPVLSFAYPHSFSFRPEACVYVCVRACICVYMCSWTRFAAVQSESVLTSPSKKEKCYGDSDRQLQVRRKVEKVANFTATHESLLSIFIQSLPMVLTLSNGLSHEDGRHKAQQSCSIKLAR